MTKKTDNSMFTPILSPISALYFLMLTLAVLLIVFGFERMGTFYSFLFLLGLVFIAMHSHAKGVDLDFATIGWHTKNLSFAVLVGVSAAAFWLVAGSFIISGGTSFTMIFTNPSPYVMDMTPLSMRIYDTTVLGVFAALGTSLLFHLAVVAPAEEIAWRGVLHRVFLGLFSGSLPLALTAGAVTFSLAHFPAWGMQQPLLYLSAALFAILMIVIYHISGSLLAPVVAHGAFNGAITISQHIVPLGMI